MGRGTSPLPRARPLRRCSRGIELRRGSRLAFDPPSGSADRRGSVLGAWQVGTVVSRARQPRSVGTYSGAPASAGLVGAARAPRAGGPHLVSQLRNVRRRCRRRFRSGDDGVFPVPRGGAHVRDRILAKWAPSTRAGRRPRLVDERRSRSRIARATRKGGVVVTPGTPHHHVFGGPYPEGMVTAESQRALNSVP